MKTKPNNATYVKVDYDAGEHYVLICYGEDTVVDSTYRRRDEAEHRAEILAKLCCVEWGTNY